MVDVEKLKAQIEDSGIPNTRIAEKMGFTTNTLKRKLEKPDTITADDIYNFAQALRITDRDELMEIFFAPNV